MYKLLPILLFAYGLAVDTEDIYDNSYALLIGIDKYQNVRSLDYAVKDAEDIQSMLVDKFHFQQDNIVLLKDEEATKTSIIQEFSNITKKAGDNDRVLIFFAGHGETQDLPDGGELGYLMPVNGDGSDLYVSAIGMEELRKISLISEAKHILYLIDACYGGIASIGARGLDAESTPDYLQKITKYKSRQIISAGGRGEQVIEKSEWGHSAFTKNLLSGLRDSKADTDSDGIITAQELGIYLKKKVTIDSDNRQTPKTRNLSTDEGEFVFVYSENTIINQQADTSTDDEFQALVLDKLDKLEKQADKTNPYLKANPGLQQSDYPLIFSSIYGDYGIYGRVTKQLDKRAVVGIGFKHKYSGKTWGGEALDYISVGITPCVGYYLTPQRTKIFNPLIMLGITFHMERWKVKTLQLNDQETELNLSLALFNHIMVEKDFGFTFGLGVERHGLMDFNEYGDLYIDRYEFKLFPVFNLDFTIPKNNYGALSSADKIKSLRERKKDDLFGLCSSYLGLIFGHYWTSDAGVTIPVIYIPAIGPFLSFSYDIKHYENIILFNGVLQTYFLFDYIKTSKKLKGLNNNISYQINLNPIAPSVKFTYDFD